MVPTIHDEPAMPTDHIRYDLLTQDALRGVVRTVLQDAARNGLPGEHHFYISFDTRSDGVRLSQRMRAQYPGEMTVVLQHQFWDLIVTDEGFEVGLSFGGVPERVGVPFQAIKGFADPSVQFGVQFEVLTAESEEGTNAPAAERAPAGQKDAAPEVTTFPPLANPAANPEPPPDNASGAGADVVRLDRFRKK
jgi:hypothetical protein